MDERGAEPGDGVIGEKPDVTDGKGRVLRAIPGTNITSMFWHFEDVSILPAGRHWRAFAIPDSRIVRFDSQVMVPMTELHGNDCVIGNATMAVLNVVPQPQTIWVRYHLDWDFALPVRFNFIIVN